MAAVRITQTVAQHCGDLPLASRLVTFVAAVVSDPTNVSTVVAAVCRFLPFPSGYNHVKRVRRSSDGAAGVPSHQEPATLVLLGPGSTVESVTVCHARGNDALTALAAVVAGYTTVAVPRYPPRDKAQFSQESKAIWPMAWVQPGASLLSAEESPASPLERAYFIAALTIAAQEAASSSSASSSPSPRGCVIALPPGVQQPEGVRTGQEKLGGVGGVGGGYGDVVVTFRGGLVTLPSPLATSAAAASGCLNGCGEPSCRSSSLLPHQFIVRAVATNAPPQTTTTTTSGLSRASAANCAVAITDPTATCVMRAMEMIAAADKTSNSLLLNSAAAVSESDAGGLPSTITGVATIIGDGGERPSSLSAAAVTPSLIPSPPGHKRRRLDHEDGVSSAQTQAQLAAADASAVAVEPVYRAAVSGGYVCTGHDAFLTHEPGPLEAMALLHARVARVIYGVPDGAHGALGGAGGGLRLHELRSVNHRYLVYRVHGLVEGILHC